MRWIVFLAIAVLPAFGEQSFRLLCKGSTKGPSVKLSPGNVQNTYQKLGYFFVWNRTGAGQKGEKLAPGTCAWVDRGPRQGEPDILAQDIRAGYRYSVDYDRPGGHVIRFRPTTNIYNWVNELRIQDKIWTFMAYNTRQGELKVTTAYAGSGVLID